MRTERLKERMMRSPLSVCPERAALWTESMRGSEGRPQPVRNALALRNVLEHMSIYIAPDELIVGNRARRPRSSPLFPETRSLHLEAQLDTFQSRPVQPYLVSEEDKREIRRFLPYWRGRSVWDRAFALMPRGLRRDSFSLTFTVEAEFQNGIGHFIVGNSNVLAQGLAGLRGLARQRMESLPAADRDGRDFLEAAAIVCDAGITFGRRFAARARREAAREPDAARRAELLRIAEICERVPGGPPRDFHEALQAVWFNQLICQIEDGGFAISPGRLDQLLGPYYRADLAAGRTTPERAQELIECFYIKLSDVVNLMDTLVLPVASGPPIAQSLTIGGVGPDGRDAVNDLTRLMLRAHDRIRTVSPNLAVRVAPDTPGEFLAEVCDAVRRGAMLALFNDTVIVAAMRRSGISAAESNDYAIVGCVEPAAPGATFGSTDSNLVNIARCLELALGNGNGMSLAENRRELARLLGRHTLPRTAGGKGKFRARAPHYLMLARYLLRLARATRLTPADAARLVSGRGLGPPTGDPAGFRGLEDLIGAYHRQVAHAVSRMARAMEYVDRAHAELKPTPYISAAIDDCVARARDVTRGGARYNFTGPQAVGLAEVADSLAAVKRVVFGEGRAGMAELVDALRHNYRGAEALRLLLLTRGPKYGNGDDEADDLARRAAAIYCHEVSRQINYRGGRYQPGIYSMSSHLVFGLLTGATPDGRKRHEPLAAGVSPHRGRETRGPTAVMRSAARLDNELVANGSVLNLSFDPGPIAGPEGLAKFTALNRSYFKLGGLQVQHNVIGAGTLREAQRDPARHTGLVVRVAGYSAFFSDLDRATQDDIIARVAHGCGPEGR